MQANPNQEGLASLTNNQQVLIFHYTLQVWGVQLRSSVDLAAVARFMHLVLGKPYNKLHTSDLYKRLQTVPNFKNRKGLLRDLARIKHFFVRVAFHEAVQLIDNDLAIARK